MREKERNGNGKSSEVGREAIVTDTRCRAGQGEPAQVEAGTRLWSGCNSTLNYSRKIFCKKGYLLSLLILRLGSPQTLKYPLSLHQPSSLSCFSGYPQN